MITIFKTSRYERERDKFVKGSTEKAELLIKALGNFSKNPLHPSLNLEKLKGNQVWTIRIDKGNRIFFIWQGEKEALLIDIGKHDKYRKY